MVGDGIEVLSTDENVQTLSLMSACCTEGWYLTYLNEGVVQNEHDCCKIPRPCFAPEKHLANIAHIPNLWVTKTELPI